MVKLLETLHNSECPKSFGTLGQNKRDQGRVAVVQEAFAQNTLGGATAGSSVDTRILGHTLQFCNSGILEF